MRKTVLMAAGSVLIVLSAVQFAAAASQHRAHKADRAPVVRGEQFRNSNAAWPAEVQPNWSAYNGGMSAPAGR